MVEDGTSTEVCSEREEDWRRWIVLYNSKYARDFEKVEWIRSWGENASLASRARKVISWQLIERRWVYFSPPISLVPIRICDLISAIGPKHIAIEILGEAPVPYLSSRFCLVDKMGAPNRRPIRHAIIAPVRECRCCRRCSEDDTSYSRWAKTWYDSYLSFAWTSLPWLL
jgi:hypothetical protein